MASPLTQLPLPFATQFPNRDFTTFLAGDNQIVLDLLTKIAKKEKTHCVYLWGESGSGKTHLLQSMCQCASEQGQFVAYIPLEKHREISSDILHDLSRFDLVCIDNLEAIVGKIEWQKGLTGLYDELQHNHHSLILTANIAPANIALEIEDIRSRLVWDQIYQLRAPTDNLKAQILKQNAKFRSFELGDDVIEYLLRRVSRDLNSLMTLLEKIDSASLSSQRKISIPFVKTLID